MNNLCDIYKSEVLINDFSTMAIGDLIEKYQVNFSTIYSTSIDLKVDLINSNSCIYNRPNRDELIEKLNNRKHFAHWIWHIAIDW